MSRKMEDGTNNIVGLGLSLEWGCSPRGRSLGIQGQMAWWAEGKEPQRMTSRHLGKWVDRRDED